MCEHVLDAREREPINTFTVQATAEVFEMPVCSHSEALFPVGLVAKLTFDLPKILPIDMFEKRPAGDLGLVVNQSREPTF